MGKGKTQLFVKVNHLHGAVVGSWKLWCSHRCATASLSTWPWVLLFRKMAQECFLPLHLPAAPFNLAFLGLCT